MADYEACNGVAIGSLEACNGVSKSNIESINGLTVPAAATGATRWVALAEDGFVGYCSNSDRTSWTGYDNDSGTSDAVDIAFGKDNNGNGIYCGTRTSGSREIVVSGTDVTQVGNWAEVDLPGGTIKQMNIQWGARSNGAAAGVWMSVGSQTGNPAGIFRSIDGAQNWSKIDLSNISGHATNKFMNGIANDGSGNWMTLQGESGGRIYYSTDDGASFAASSPFQIGRGQAIAYTNNTWVVVYSRQSNIQVRCAAASDITTWSSELDITPPVPHLTQDGQKVSIACANGRCAVVGQADGDVAYFDVNGTTTPTLNTASQITSAESSDSIFDVATDGTTWLISCKDGDIYEAAHSDLSSWTRIVDGFQANSGGSNVANREKDLVGICADVILPL